MTMTMLRRLHDGRLVALALALAAAAPARAAAPPTAAPPAPPRRRPAAATRSDPAAPRAGTGGDAALGTRKYSDYEKPAACASCHVDIARQHEQAMMSQSYTHAWDEIEYFELAVPHAAKNPKVAGRQGGLQRLPRPARLPGRRRPPAAPGEGLAGQRGGLLRRLPHHRRAHRRSVGQLQLDLRAGAGQAGHPRRRRPAPTTR